MQPILEIKNLSIGFEKENEKNIAVDDISFSIPKSSITAIVGESGSGKSLTALSILNLLPSSATTSGKINFLTKENKIISIINASQKDLNNFRGNQISMIFQEPMTSLNPVLTCGFQVAEVLLKNKNLSKKEAKEKTIELFRKVELPQPEKLFSKYPHQISGGQKQRVMIAIAISCNPKLLIADEPTTALDVRVQQSILNLLKKIREEFKMSVLLITHDLGLVSDYADKVMVMYKGKIVEQGKTKVVLQEPNHPYTRALMMCRPNEKSKGKKLPILKDFLKPESPLEEKSMIAESKKSEEEKKPILCVQSLKVIYPAARNFFGKITTYHKAIDDINFEVMPGETLGIVGESGCGKTTLAKTILQLIQPTAGSILINGKDIFSKKNKTAALKKEMQIVFQDPYGSLNPKMTIGEALSEPMKVHRLFSSSSKRKERISELLYEVSIGPEAMNKYPHEFSGGQRQRICIARALALEPSFLVFDESVSALDVSIQAQILNLINELKSKHGFTSIFISHDLSIVHYISDRILVMKEGRIVEQGSAEKIFFHPENEYTQQLLAAIPGRKSDI